jgi:integrase
MTRLNFTAERVAGFKCDQGKQQCIYWDGKTPGLGLRVTAAGTKSFIFETRLHGKTLRITIGDVRTWSIGNAQKQATELKSLTDKGIDPRQQRAEQQVAAEAARLETMRRAATLESAWAVYIEERQPRWSELNYRDHVDLSSSGGQPKKRGKGDTEPGPLASLLPLKLSELTAERIGEWMRLESAKRPSRTRLAFNLLRIFATWCESKALYRGLIDAQSLSTRIARDTLPKKQSKSDALQREQLAPWFQAVQQISNPVMSTYLIGVLLTGARREELAGLKWNDVDFQWRSLTIRDKVDGQRVIPLPPYLAARLLDLKRINETPPNVRQLRRLETRGEVWQPSPWVFFSKTSAEGKLAAPNSALHKACQIAGIPPVTLHGLRRSFSSLAEWTETPTGVVAQIMGHKPSATAEKHYKVRPLDLLRVWHDKLEAWVLGQANVSFTPTAPALRLATVV